VYSRKLALLLDMNSTFMFGEDNFDLSQDFSRQYHHIGGNLKKQEINKLIRSVYTYMEGIYPDEDYRNNFPSIKYVIKYVLDYELSDDEISNVVDTFSFHEIGYITDEYVEVLRFLHSRFKLSVVIDIWSPKYAWANLFKKLGIDNLFSASSYSSDHGMVKPSPKPFELVIEELGINKNQGLVIGDSVRRDLGGANAAGIDCVLVGGEKDSSAVGCYENLLQFSRAL